MSIERNKEIVRRYHTELWAGNLSIIDELIADDYNSVMGGRDGIKAFANAWLSAMPNSKLHIEELIAEGDTVVMRWRASGTNTGPDKTPDGSPMPPTGKPFTYTGITINKVINGKIVSDVYENSWLAMLQQMQTA